MCETQVSYLDEFPADERGGELLAEAASAVVAAMSDDSIRNLFEQWVCWYIADVGDQSDLPMFERVVSHAPPPPPYHVLDKHRVRVTCAAAAAVVNLLPGPDRTEQAARLAISTMRGIRFGEVIQ